MKETKEFDGCTQLQRHALVAVPDVCKFPTDETVAYSTILIWYLPRGRIRGSKVQNLLLINLSCVSIVRIWDMNSNIRVHTKPPHVISITRTSHFERYRKFRAFFSPSLPPILFISLTPHANFNIDWSPTPNPNLNTVQSFYRAGEYGSHQKIRSFIITRTILEFFKLSSFFSELNIGTCSE